MKYNRSVIILAVLILVVSAFAGCSKAKPDTDEVSTGVVELISDEMSTFLIRQSETGSSEPASVTAPVTVMTTTAAVTTTAVTTTAPTTVAVTATAPTTAAVTTAPPTTAAPTTRAPATQAPATRAPVTQPPTTKAPATQAPTTVQPKSVSVPAVAAGIASTGYFDNRMVEESNPRGVSRVLSRFGFDDSACSEVSYYKYENDGAASPEEILVVKANDRSALDTVVRGMEGRRSAQTESFADYGDYGEPGAGAKAANAVIFTDGLYAVYCCSNNASAVQSYIRSLF